MSLKVDRRAFLRFAGGGALGLASSGITVKGLSDLNAALAMDAREVPGGPEGWSLSVCSLCPGGCGLRVRTIGKRAVKIEGNTLHPVSRGGLCPRGLAGLQVTYHPDRLHGPQKNVGGRGTPRWKETSWEEALGTVVERLRGLQKHGQTQSAVFVGGRCGYLRKQLFQRFLRAYGSPNCFWAPNGLEAAQTAAYLQQGLTEGIAYDLDATRYLVSFGANLLEGWGSPVSNMHAFGRWRDAAAGRRSKLVQVEPRFSVTAARADEWVAVRPGTEAALALGIAYVLITEGLYDARFISEHTFGFEDWRDGRDRTHLGFRSLVLNDYRLNTVANLTQVPAETILRVGREMGRNRPALAISGGPSTTLPGDPYTAMAVHSLNALLGSLEVPGGALARREFAWGEEAKEQGPSLLNPEGALLPLPDLTQLPDAITAGKPYPVQALLIHGTDPVFSLPNGAQLAEALKRVPFVVSFSPFLDETSAYADLVLPDHTDLEKWQEAASPPTFPFSLQSLSAPVIEPVHQSRDAADVVLDLAHTLGGEAAAALPQANFEEYLREQAEEIFRLRSGYTFTNSLEETWNRLLERSGWWAPTYDTAEQLWAQMKEHGGWWEPTYYFGEWNRVLQTPSRRFEFYSQRLGRWAAQHRESAKAAGLESSDDRACLPHQPALPKPPPDFPILLIPIEVLPLAGGDGAHLPYLQQIAGSYVFEHWESWLEMSPHTATELGVANRDWVWVESPRAKVRVRVRLYAGVQPGVVHLPLGYGRTQGSSWGRRGVNPLSLVETRPEPRTPWPQPTQIYVRIYKS